MLRCHTEYSEGEEIVWTYALKFLAWCLKHTEPLVCYVHSCLNCELSAQLTPQINSCSEINARDTSGQTPLHLACERGDMPCVKELLEESQARTDIKDHSGETSMHIAAKQDSPAVMQVRLNLFCTELHFTVLYYTVPNFASLG